MRIVQTLVRQVRVARGLTLKQMAQKIKISEGQVSRLERGLTEPRILQALKVSEVLDASVRELWPSQEIKYSEQTEINVGKKPAKSKAKKNPAA